MNKSVQIKERIAGLCRAVYSKNMVSGSGGNISMRADNIIYITPSGYSLGNIKSDDIVEVSMDGKVNGSIRPSKELFLHIEAYKSRPEINTVIHVHSMYSVLVGILADTEGTECPMPAYTPGYAIRVKSLKIVPFFVPGSLELAESISEKLQESNVILMKNHGMVIVGKELKEAFNLAEEVEENAKMHIMLKGQGALSQKIIKSILKKYQ